MSHPIKQVKPPKSPHVDLNIPKLRLQGGRLADHLNDLHHRLDHVPGSRIFRRGRCRGGAEPMLASLADHVRDTPVPRYPIVGLTVDPERLAVGTSVGCARRKVLDAQAKLGDGRLEDLE